MKLKRDETQEIQQDDYKEWVSTSLKQTLDLLRRLIGENPEAVKRKLGLVVVAIDSSMTPIEVLAAVTGTEEDSAADLVTTLEHHIKEGLKAHMEGQRPTN